MQGDSLSEFLIHMYKELDVRDIGLTYEASLSRCDDVKIALAKAQLNLWPHVLDNLAVAAERYSRHGESLSNTERMSINCNNLDALRHLQQWDSLLERSRGNWPDLEIEANSMLNNWNLVRKQQKNVRPRSLHVNTFISFLF